MTTHESRYRTAAHCVPRGQCRTEAWSFRGIMEAQSKEFQAKTLRIHSTHYSLEGWLV